MADKVFYDVFETETHFEYHVNRDSELVETRRAMSKRIAKDHPDTAHVMLRWFNEAANLGLVRVFSFEQ